jgi:hypothetical protein
MTDRNNQCYVRVTRVQWAAWSIVPSITLNEPWTPRQTWATDHWECSCLILPLKYGVHAYSFIFVSWQYFILDDFSYNILERNYFVNIRADDHPISQSSDRRRKAEIEPMTESAPRYRVTPAPILIKCTLHFRVLVINRAIHMMNLTVVVLENTSLMGSTANSYLFIYY